MVCDYIAGGPGSPASRAAFLERFGNAISPGFDPDEHLSQVGCANQTTMLSTESVEVGDMFREAMRARYGEAQLSARFRAFDTICSATQDRQDAVVQLLAEKPIDLMLVIGGYNSSNTCNLARICAEKVPTYHIANPDGLLSAHAIRYRSVSSKSEVVAEGWLPAEGSVSVGLTSGASTPDNLVEVVVRKLVDYAHTPS